MSLNTLERLVKLNKRVIIDFKNFTFENSLNIISSEEMR